MVWSQIIFDIVIIYLHRLTQLMMKQIGHKFGLYLTAWARGKNMAVGPLSPHLIRPIFMHLTIVNCKWQKSAPVEIRTRDQRVRK
jgi:hypothetical protein